jgi:hypothetical protein
MKANELRIGNLVYYGDNIAYVSAVFRTHFNCEDSVTGISFDNSLQNNFTPILLTEEWLEKLGFWSKYKSNHLKWTFYGFDIDQVSDEDENGNEIPQEQTFHYAYQYEIKYVHQLQNLYFALFEKELTINL